MLKNKICTHIVCHKTSRIMEDPRSETERNCNGLLHNIYRSHPKGAEDTVFTGVCLSTGGVPRFQVLSWGGGVPQTQVLSLVSGPRFFPRGVPQSQPEGGYPREGTLPAGTGVLLPKETGQQSEYLLCGGRYASCGHAGGLIITGVKIISYCFHCLRGRVGAFTMTCT